MNLTKLQAWFQTPLDFPLCTGGKWEKCTAKTVRQG